MPKIPEGFAPQPAEGVEHLFDSGRELVTCDNCGAEVTETVEGLCPPCLEEAS